MNQETFTELLVAHRDRLYSHALYSLRNAHDAEDVTQEAFLKLWRNYQDIDPARAGSWLTRVVHNLCIDQARRHRSRQNNLGHPDVEAVAQLATVDNSPANPEHGLQLNERQQALLNAMATLTPETRSVLIMHYFQDMKLQEIGDVLDKSVSALKVQIHRARKSLRLVLDSRTTESRPAQRGIG